MTFTIWRSVPDLDEVCGVSHDLVDVLVRRGDLVDEGIGVAVLDAHDGLAPRVVRVAAESLIRFNAKMDTTKVGEPAFLGVITTKAAAVRRPGDGVLTLPIGVLGP